MVIINLAVVKMVITERKRRLASLLNWLMSEGDKTQTQLADEIKISSSSMSLFSNVTARTPEASSITKQRIVSYLQANRDPRWSRYELESYLEGSGSIESFAAKLAKKAIADKDLTLDDQVEMMDDKQLINLMAIIANHLQKKLRDRSFTTSCA